MRRFVLFITALALIILGCMDFSDSPAEPEPLPPPGGGGGGGDTGLSGTLTLFQGGAGAGAQPGAMDARRAAMLAAARTASARNVSAGAQRKSPAAAPHRLQAALPPSPEPRPEFRADPGWSAFPRERTYLPGELIVRTEEIKDAATLLRDLQLPGLRVEHKGFATEHLHLVRYLDQKGAPLDLAASLELAATLSARPGIRFAEVNAVHYPTAVPNDTYYGHQWHYPAMSLPAAWDVTQGSAATVVAIVDTGIVSHPDLAAKVLPGVDMITDPARAGDGNGRDNDPTDMGGDQPNGGSSWHGTHVAGTVAAHSNNGAGVAGVNWAARILPVRVLGRDGGTLFDIASGMAWAYGANVPGMAANANPARVVNLSLAGGGADPSPTYQDVIDAGVSQGVVFVIAAGNANENAAKTTPCNQNNVVCVGATRLSGKRSSFSNFGGVVDVMAPGGEVAEDLNGDGFPDGILSTVRNAQGQASWDFQQGTSMAAPHVAGLVALMKGLAPGLTHGQVEAMLKSTANPAFQCSEGCGAGMVNAHAAVLAANGQTPTGPAKLVVATSELFLSAAQPDGAVFLSNTGGQSLTVTATGSGAQAGALSFPAGNLLTLPAGKSAALAVRANIGALPVGTHGATLTLTSGGGNAAVTVRMRAGPAETKDATVVVLYLENEEWKSAGVVVAPAAGEHKYALDVLPGTYFVLAAVDDDGDGEFFEDGERVGIYPVMNSPEFVTLEKGQRKIGVDFALIPYVAVEGGGSAKAAIGGACAANADCASVDCITAWPGGYCTQDCQTTCPGAATCYSLSTASGPVNACLANCPAPGAGQGTCRAQYVCYPDTAGTGYCWPRCTSNADCASTCNTTTGYCQ